MKNYLYSGAFLALLFMLLPLCAQCADSGEKVLEKLSSAVRDLGRYEADFRVEVSGEEMSAMGSYMVDGERYMLNIGGQKIFGDAAVRYTVDSQNREVVIEPIDSSVPMVIANPAQAFSRLDESFSVAVISNDESYKLSLTPLTSGLSVESSLLEIDRTTMLPRSVSYSADGDKITIHIERLNSTENSIPPLGEIEYPKDFSVIDLR